MQYMKIDIITSTYSIHYNMSSVKCFSIFKKAPLKKDAEQINTITDSDIVDIQENSELDTSILSDEQKIAYELYKGGKNVFLTGPGGTGKTKLIQYFIHYSKIKNQNLQVCAMTGCAAILLNCNARTLHSWSGIKLAKGDRETVINKVVNNRNAKKSWKKTNILILDEVSMLSKKVFEIIEEIARTIKKDSRPFGGMQIIFSGDFCQLPPVGTSGDKETYKFCFESPLWNQVFPLRCSVELKTIFRQTDELYTNILQGIRKGKITKKNCTILQNRVNTVFDPEKHNGCVPTKLFPLRSKVDYINNMMFNKLTAENSTFEVVVTKNEVTYVDNGKNIPTAILSMCNDLTANEVEYEVNQLINNTPCIQNLHLKTGAAVMCTINLDMDNSICNGSQGIIIDINIINGAKIPIVKFSNGIVKQIHPHTWQSEEFPTLSISQIPLCLSWALTIHKIQGATLQFAEIDVGNSVFEYGQTYVALSRVQSLEGLYLSAFNYEKIQTNPSVIQFYETISNYTPELINEKNALDENTIEPNIKHIVL